MLENQSKINIGAQRLIQTNQEEMPRIETKDCRQRTRSLRVTPISIIREVVPKQ